MDAEAVHVASSGGKDGAETGLVDKDETMMSLTEEKRELVVDQWRRHGQDDRDR